MFDVFITTRAFSQLFPLLIQQLCMPFIDVSLYMFIEHTSLFGLNMFLSLVFTYILTCLLIDTEVLSYPVAAFALMITICEAG